ncbi:hypothetical protein TNCV_13601 [Trichonephila clavipes]|nr:hypothetical protein TNCV_13601 [Trichonephila clavipes]
MLAESLTDFQYYNATICKEMGSDRIPPSYIWLCDWLGDANWWLVVGGVSEARTIGVAGADWRTESTKWMLGVSIKWKGLSNF